MIGSLMALAASLPGSIPLDGYATQRAYCQPDPAKLAGLSEVERAAVTVQFTPSSVTFTRLTPTNYTFTDTRPDIIKTSKGFNAVASFGRTRVNRMTMVKTYPPRYWFFVELHNGFLNRIRGYFRRLDGKNNNIELVCIAPPLPPALPSTPASGRN